jgi:hypothetical protein
MCSVPTKCNCIQGSMRFSNLFVSRGVAEEIVEPDASCNSARYVDNRLPRWNSDGNVCRSVAF